MKKKNNWATAKGKVVGVRFDDMEHRYLMARAEGRGMSTGSYLKWLLRMTKEYEGALLIERGVERPVFNEYEE